jgi:hypothetical protein
MEIIELIGGLIEGCGCFLEVLTALNLVGAGVAGAQVQKKVKERKETRKRGETPRPWSEGDWIVMALFWGLVATGVVLLSLSLYKRLR